MKKITNFFSEVKHEMVETNWPSSQELRKNSLVIFSVLIFFGAFFYLSDLIISFALNIF